jgi:hypothetical protein
MQELRDSSRAAAREKAKRLAAPNKGRIDASGWTEPKDFDASAPTGMRPVSRRAFKAGGAVAGEESKARGDRKPRKSGGVATEMMNRNQKDANEDRPGVKQVGGMKKGGVVEGSAKDKREDKAMARAKGMTMKEWEDSPEDAKHDRPEKGFGGEILPMLLGGVGGYFLNKLINKKKDDGGGSNTTTSTTGPATSMAGTTMAKKGGRIKRATGGATKGKGKMNVNIIIAPQGGKPQPMGVAPDMPPPPPRAVPVPMPPQGPPPGAGGGSPITINGGAGGMPPGMPGQPPMGRKRGGSVKGVNEDAGAGSGVGRLEKIGKAP